MRQLDRGNWIAAIVLIAACQSVFGQQLLPLWNGSFAAQNQNYQFTMVGADPATSNATTNVNVYIIPLTVTFDSTTCASGQNTFSPSTKVSNGNTVTQNVVASPVFTAIPFSQGGNQTMQYIDAFQRANFWLSIQQHSTPHYHLNLTPVVLNPQSVEVSSSTGGASDNTFYGGCVGAVANSFTNQLLALLPNSGAQTDGVAFFLTDDVFLGYYAGGGWHPSGGGAHFPPAFTGNGQLQTWLWATYNDGQCGNNPCLFADVTDVTHEVAEWADDPLFGNTTPCGQSGSRR
jgi:hypothetical protein